MDAMRGEGSLRILVYGVELKGIATPKRKLACEKYALHFFDYKESPRFQDFDGVIFFQGTFEVFERKVNDFQSYLQHRCDRDELDRRTNETNALLEKGGFACILLTDKFIDFDERRDFRETDLSKRLLLAAVHRNNLHTRMPLLVSKVNELSNFFRLYGAASSSFSARGSPIKTLASVNGNSVSVAIRGHVFAIPTLLPERAEAAVEEYFTTLADGIVSLREHLKAEVPAWASEFRFPTENALLATKLDLSHQISQIEGHLLEFERFKRALVVQGDALVDAIFEIFEKVLPLKPKREEAFREDLILIDTAGNAVALVEVKGVSRGVAREHINQADSHRERNEKPPHFPSLLIMNTHMKNSVSVADKDQAPAPEQIQHAARNNILILRTLDLLNLCRLHMSGTLPSEEVVALLTKSRGWLKVEETAQVLSA